ncbi:hypothetical protein ACJMK2_014105 [Sinanodonta woodiana]|uniref:Uncharacterized protein n=1 Tax=Sinanodonta woodiana TaxID=1069815 RepID=A0ABD3V1M8_SINWO
MTSVVLPSYPLYLQSEVSALMQSTAFGYSEQHLPHEHHSASMQSLSNSFHSRGAMVIESSNDVSTCSIEQSPNYTSGMAARKKQQYTKPDSASTSVSQSFCHTSTFVYSSSSSCSRSETYSPDCYSAPSSTNTVDLNQLTLELLDCSSSSGSSEKHSPGSSLTSRKPLYTAELQVMCRICGDRASGFHYGVHSCEGCKGFFRRTLKKKLVYKPCREGSKCRIDAGTRNKCQYCRYKKCLNAGMSQDAVRFGRMPKTEREKLQADREELVQLCSKRILDLRSLSDVIKASFYDCFDRYSIISNFLIDRVSFDSVTADKLEPGQTLFTNTLDSETFKEKEVFKCFQEIAVPVLEGTVKFARRIPDFSTLTMAEQIALMKQNSYCVTLILLHVLFEDKTLYLCGRQPMLSVTRSKEEYMCLEAEWLFEGIFSIAQKLLSMHLTLVEVALYSAAVLLLESPFLESRHTVENLQMELLHSLRLELKHNHPREKLMFPRLLVLIPQLVQIAELFRQNLKDNTYDMSHDFSNTHPLFVEIFGLK